ncbi:MAG TPA: DNA-processing protein DprA [Candidatus Limnocylindria bacterium]|nr:DNA-processing protein DprA [Candidatus Limnocylindria bacterium]
MLNPARDLPLLAALRLRVPGRALRALAAGDTERLRAWLAGESALRLAEARRDARLDFDLLASMGARIAVPSDDEWPAGFADLRDPPALLSVRGALPRAGIAVVGARDADARACGFARAFAAALRAPIVAGLAPGIDEAAHRGALDAGAPTVAYVGGGLARLEDPVLADAIVAGGGAVASECGPTVAPSAWSRMRRDRLQAAHARAVVLVVSDAAGGAMHTLRFAREAGRACFAFASDASGNVLALAAGARPLPWDAREAAAAVKAEVDETVSRRGDSVR